MSRRRAPQREDAIEMAAVGDLTRLDDLRRDRIERLLYEAREHRARLRTMKEHGLGERHHREKAIGEAERLEAEAARLESEMGTFARPRGGTASRKRAAAPKRYVRAASPARGLRCDIPRDPRTGRFVSRSTMSTRIR